MYANNVYKTYLLCYLFFFKMGIKKAWIEKAWPIAAAIFIAPVPKGLNSFGVCIG